MSFKRGPERPQVDRREVLKYFGIGTVIAPVSGAAAPLARLIDVPKVELVETIPAPVRLTDVASFTVTLNLRDGSQRTIKSGSGPYVLERGVLAPGMNLSVAVKFERMLGGGSPIVTKPVGELYAYPVEPL